MLSQRHLDNTETKYLLDNSKNNQFVHSEAV